ncbi:unnamed protein product [Cladocopium goreaui]|uniref:Polycystin-2 n=1 Tax=Cladocopium goreaui TaxID=2562237 RepID=A0A9P1GJG9_9DINO|nr:unnamed protein product [Cladocopium goreaui]
MPKTKVIRFAIYAFIATFVIKARSQVEDLSIANDGTKSALTEQYFEFEPRPRKFNDIKDVKDVQSWLRWLCNSLQAAGNTDEYSNPLSLNLHNRVTPTSGICLNASSITLSFRRVKLSSDAAASTTTRFSAFYPQTWKAFTIDPGTDLAGSDIEATSPIVASTPSTLSWLYTPACKSCSNTGYNQMGGYIAVATTSASGTLVHLVDSSDVSGLAPDPMLNHCDGNLTRSGTLGLEDFLGEPFFDSQLGSLTAEFQTYNANFQSLTKVKVFFQFSAAGALFAHRVETQTLQLDISHSWIQYFEYTYLVFTCFYFFDLVYRIGKGFPTYLQNFWCYVNACSIIASIGCFGIWYFYMPTLDTFRQTRLFQDYTNFDNRSATFGFYIVTSSFAVFTIYLRMLQFLGHTRSRVVLLLRTITFSAGNIIIYILYIGVIFIGFSTFALTNFSNVSANFTNPWVTFVSTFSLFMGDLSVMDGFNTPLKVPFMWLFMFFFFFLSVQMFNAIINYAYNRVSEDMKSVFQREQLEKQLKKKTKAGRDGRMFWPFPFGRKPKGQEELAEDGVTFGGAVKGPDLTTLDPGVRQKVEEYRERDTKKSAKDGLCTACVYFLMVGCYIGFLYVNMLVEEKNQLRLAVEAVVRNTEVEMPLPFGKTAAQSWDDISTWSQVASWMRVGLPAIIFNSTAQAFMETSTTQQLISSGMNCLRSWNCLITGASQNQTDGSQNIARITQKRSKRMQNRGSRSSATPEDERFVGGFDDSGDEIQGILVNESGFFQIIHPDVANAAEDADLDFQLLHQNQLLCQTVGAGAGSYRQSGGIVCELSSDAATFREQMDALLGNGNETNRSFFVKESASFVIELVAHNPNRDMLSYIVMTFYQTPAGKVHKDIRVFSLALFGWDVGVDKLGYFIGRLVPGAIYMTLVVAFTIMLYQEMQTEHTRRSVAESAEKGNSLFTTIFTFFASDVFRPVDAISYLMSFWSFVLFILWLVKEGDLQQKLQGDYRGIVDFTSELITTEKDYNRISAANLLLLFVRPLRFIREDPRMQRLNQTLHDAKQDIFWFIVVLGIVLFACTLLANVSFGPFFLPCIDIAASFLFCFSFILGEFDFWGLYGANPVMAVIFFFPYLILVYCVFTNIFFAILDRFFVSADPPPMKLKRKLKPLLSKICRCIDWDDDFVMEEDPKGAKKEGPQSRADRVAVTAKIIHDIRKGIDGDSGSRLAQSKPLSEVCDMDEKLLNVVKWSKEEASSIVSEFQSLLVKKQRHKNEDVFLKQVVMKKVDDDETNTRKEMEEAHRQMRYAAEVHEVMALRDQQTLAKYIWLLEQKIQKKMTDTHALMMEVQHLQDEMDRMRFTKEDLRNHANGVGSDIPQEEIEGSASEGEHAETMSEAVTTHAGPKPIDPNSAMDSAGGRSDPATADMLKALHG